LELLQEPMFNEVSKPQQIIGRTIILNEEGILFWTVGTSSSSGFIDDIERKVVSVAP